MSEIKDGGQAFPLPITLSAEGHEHIAYPGMTLRDYFASKFMQGWMASWNGSNPNAEGLKLTAETAYDMADSMLRARSQS